MSFRVVLSGWESDDDGAAQVPVHQEQLPLPQGQDAEGGDHQTITQRGGKNFIFGVTVYYCRAGLFGSSGVVQANYSP
jgi:hypothetical protein